MPRKPRNEYRQFAALWERRRNDPDRGGVNWLVEPAGLAVDDFGLAVDAGDLIKTLRALGNITQDEAFNAARSALITHAAGGRRAGTGSDTRSSRARSRGRSAKPSSRQLQAGFPRSRRSPRPRST